jgi:TPR repeat protein
MAENGLGGLKEVYAAREWYEKAAEGGNRYAMERLVELYSGKANSNFSYNRAKMQKWQAQLAENGDAEMAFELAEELSTSSEPADLLKATRFYGIAADAGNLEAAVKWSRAQILGTTDQADFHGGVSMLRQIAKSDPLRSLKPLSGLIRGNRGGGDAIRAEAERNLFLGLAYQYGIVLPVDPDKAEIHLKEAAPRLAAGSYALADFLLTVVPDRQWAAEEAVTLLYPRAYRGYQPARERLAQLFQDGELIERRMDKALFWWQIAGEQSAVGRVAAARIRLEEGRTGADWEQVLVALEDDAEAGVAEAASLLGKYYAEYAKRPDPKRAVRWYEKASRFGSSNALIELGNLYKTGKLVEPDPARACAYFERAAEQGAIAAEQEMTFCKTVESTTGNDKSAHAGDQ